MRATLLSAAAALVFASISSTQGFAQQNEEEGYQPSQQGGYGMHYRHQPSQEGGQEGGYGMLSRGGDRGGWRERSGARFRFSRGNAKIDIRCPQNDSLQDCVEAASRLIDKLHSLAPEPTPTSAPEATPSPGATPSH